MRDEKRAHPTPRVCVRCRIQILFAFHVEVAVREKLALAEEIFRLILYVAGLALIFVTTLIGAWNELVSMIRAW